MVLNDGRRNRCQSSISDLSPRNDDQTDSTLRIDESGLESREQEQRIDAFDDPHVTDMTDRMMDRQNDRHDSTLRIDDVWIGAFLAESGQESGELEQRIDAFDDPHVRHPDLLDKLQLEELSHRMSL